MRRTCSPQVRAAAVYALGTFVDNQPDSGSDHAAHVNQAVGATLTPLHRREASVLVRCELVCALQRLVACYDSSFAAIAFRFVEEEKNWEVAQQGKSTAFGGQCSPNFFVCPLNFVVPRKILF